jgi:hypothetical protein
MRFTFERQIVCDFHKGTLKVGDLLTKDCGDGKKLWKVVEILNGVCYVDEPNIWDEAFARQIGW